MVHVGAEAGSCAGAGSRAVRDAALGLSSGVDNAVHVAHSLTVDNSGNVFVVQFGLFGYRSSSI